MTKLQEPLPCPFCGSKHVGHTKLDYREFVICNRCGAGADSADTAPEKTALEVWNTRAALAQQCKQPVAYITETEQGPMVWTQEMYDEACTYCDDGEFPVPLFTRPMPAQDVTELVEALERVLNCCDIAECSTVPNSPVL